MEVWQRIPAPIADEQDRRTLCAILAAHDLEVRIVKERKSERGVYLRYVEFRPQEII